MNHTPRRLFALALLLLTAAGCVPGPSTASTRPACVTLESYSGVIEQVMNLQPDWQPVDSNHVQWVVADEKGEHTLTARLTPQGCVCAAGSTSYVSTGGAEMAGLMQGAAVAPVSELGYTASWLEPKLMFYCGAANLFGKAYQADAAMKDGTSWNLLCSSLPDSDTFRSLYTLTVTTPDCPNLQ